MTLPEWANWLARDEDGVLYAFEKKPIKYGERWEVSNLSSYVTYVTETDDCYKNIKWEDEEPTEIKRESEISRVLTEELNRIKNAVAHGFDHIPNLSDIVNIPNLSEIPNSSDIVNKPNHYIGEQGLEVETVLQNFIPRYTDSYEAHRIASAIEYLLRSPLKNGIQDIKKAKKNLEQVLEYRELLEEKE